MKGTVALDADLFVSGHGEADTFEGVWAQQRLKNAEETRNPVVAMVKQGTILPQSVSVAMPPTGSCLAIWQILHGMWPAFVAETETSDVNS